MNKKMNKEVTMIKKGSCHPLPPPSLSGMAFSSVLQHNHSPTSVMTTRLVTMVTHHAHERGKPPYRIQSRKWIMCTVAAKSSVYDQGEKNQ